MSCSLLPRPSPRSHFLLRCRTNHAFLPNNDPVVYKQRSNWSAHRSDLNERFIDINARAHVVMFCLSLRRRYVQWSWVTRALCSCLSTSKVLKRAFRRNAILVICVNITEALLAASMS
ncbi:Peptide deformylase [Candidatus Hodgkinia cicadicola]|nr:Peptide deformylase [Candidatus Hodgkinia cicadicola]